jgi:hypothetical protein
MAVSREEYAALLYASMSGVRYLRDGGVREWVNFVDI